MGSDLGPIWVLFHNSNLEEGLPSFFSAWILRGFGLIGRSVCAVKAQRLKMGMRQAPRPEHKPWTRREERLLGKKPDAELAKRFDRTLLAVIARRERLGIPCLDPKIRPWTPEEEKLLGTDLDRNIGKRLGRHEGVVHRRCKELGIPSFDRKPWTTADEAVLGTIPDLEAAKRLGRTLSAIRGRREKRGSSGSARENLLFVQVRTDD